MSAIQVACTFDAASRRKDRSVRLAFTTNLEISPAEYLEMDKRIQQTGWLLFSPNELQESDIPQEPATSVEGKSKGQRMRAVHFLVWQKAHTDEPFDTWYDRRFEAYMSKWKENLD